MAAMEKNQWITVIVDEVKQHYIALKKSKYFKSDLFGQLHSLTHVSTNTILVDDTDFMKVYTLVSK